MYKKLILLISLLVLSVKLCASQVIQFGTCADIQSMPFFDLERFLGEWYEIERFPHWYERYGECAFIRFQYCERRVEIEHVYVRNGVRFILQRNSSYAPGDEAIFMTDGSNIDPMGIPLSVLSTDYTNYAVVYGCKYNENLDIKYPLESVAPNVKQQCSTKRQGAHIVGRTHTSIIDNLEIVSAWILSRTSNMSEESLQRAYHELNSIPYANVAYLEKVEQKMSLCSFHWTAIIAAENITESMKTRLISDNDILVYT